MSEFSKRMVDVHVRIPMDFPTDWTDEECEFQLNESSWSWSNFVDDLNLISDNGQKCICAMCHGKVAKERTCADDAIMKMMIEAETGRRLS